jgi:membrane protein YqaA with SNARE-associated domain
MGLIFHRLIAAAWGFAEATLFFIVPDVWLSYLAVRLGFMRAFWAGVFCVAGAIAGGLVLYGISLFAGPSLLEVMDALPAISRGMIDDAGAALRGEPMDAMIIGSLSGVPYKIFAAQAATAGLSPLELIAFTGPARALRFILVCALAGAVAQVLQRWISSRQLLYVHAGCWLTFYAYYFSVMPN